MGSGVPSIVTFGTRLKVVHGVALRGEIAIPTTLMDGNAPQSPAQA